jgi:plastocyanin domain-containing protein
MRLAPILAASLLSLAAVAVAEPPPVRTIEMQVTKAGFVPDKLQVKKGQPLKLVITRTTERTCATEIVIKELGINQPLPLNKAVTVQFTPAKAGTLRYACAMDMIAGTIVVQ